jgi:hypothetical protein
MDDCTFPGGNGADGPPLDIIYLFRHSRPRDERHRDEEIRFSLRSVAANLPFIRKVWIFGDRPAFLTDDHSIAEHVPHAYIAPLLGFKSPVRNDMLMLVLASLLPEVAFDFVRFSDDYIVLQPLSRQQLCQVRVLEDLNRQPSRGAGKWKQLLWNTFDTLKKYGYPGYNFETHVPAPLNRKLVFEAFMAFRSFQTEERYAGMVSATTVYNYALKHGSLELAWLGEEKSRVGFYGKCPPAEQVAATCQGKLFLSFDDAAFGPDMIQFLQSRFPNACKFERPESATAPAAISKKIAPRS